jgi:hypothetical protein
MMASVRASKGDWAEASFMLKEPTRAMSLPSLGSAAVRCWRAAAWSYGGLRVRLGCMKGSVARRE